ncbi:hypothetical protein SERLADRAFT_471467, partial [Serpula lacrymans var. lacrymans S7.9]
MMPRESRSRARPQNPDIIILRNLNSHENETPSAPGSSGGHGEAAPQPQGPPARRRARRRKAHTPPTSAIHTTSDPHATPPNFTSPNPTELSQAAVRPSRLIPLQRNDGGTRVVELPPPYAPRTAYHT